MILKPAANPAFDDKAPESPSNRRVLAVFDPQLLDYLPAWGRDVGEDHGMHWHRRIMQKDVTVITAAELAAGEDAEAARLKAAAEKIAAEEAAAKKAADGAAPKEGAGGAGGKGSK